MKLSEIIAFKNHLTDATPLNGTLVAHDRLAPILHLVTSNEIQFDHLVTKLNQDYKNILSHINYFEGTIEDIKDQIDTLIEQMEPTYFNESYRIYCQEMIYDTADVILGRRLNLTADNTNYIVGRVQLQGNWQHAAMIIHPGREEWITHLVGNDPLYLIAPTQELLDPAVLRFNDQYKQRLRTYTVTESIDNPILERLPDTQFGFCLVYNFFNYKPQEIVNQYLTEIYQKLKPGGVVAFTFNDCDQAGGASLAERNFMCYTPGRTVLAHAQAVGFQVRHRYKIDNSCTWLELYRPGILTSLRGGQSLAKVVDIDDTFKYTNEEIKNIRQQAADLNMYNPNGNTPTVIDHIPIPQLVKLIKQRKKEE
jgi:SAM-dependent methyltransferase